MINRSRIFTCHFQAKYFFETEKPCLICVNIATVHFDVKDFTFLRETIYRGLAKEGHRYLLVFCAIRWNTFVQIPTHNLSLELTRIEAKGAQIQMFVFPHLIVTPEIAHIVKSSVRGSI